MSKISVLIVDDSAFMRQLLRNVIDAQDDMRVVGIARDGVEAVQKAKSLKPDVVTLDVAMPKFSGSDALKIIMKESPTKVIMVSSFTAKGVAITMECLSYGAFDFIEKPSGSIALSFDEIKDELISKIRSAARTNIDSLLPKQNKPNLYRSASKQSSEQISVSTNLSSSNKILLIASSTGGPRSLEKIIPLLPKNLGCPGIIVQHMPPGFTKSLADRLEKASNIMVKEAEDGEVLSKDTIYIAPGNYHLGMRQQGDKIKLFLDSSNKINNVRPAADFTFDMASHIYGKNIICVVLTGMGKDGAFGATKIKSLGGIVIAESKETSVVFGMPKAVIDAGSADYVLDNTDIAKKIISLL